MGDHAIIILLGCDPAVDEQARAIEHKMRATDHCDALALIPARAADPSRLRAVLRRHNPHLVHFSSRGARRAPAPAREISLGADLLATETLLELMEPLRHDVHAVILDGAYSHEQAQAVARHIDCVVRIRDDAGPRAATAFAAAFYREISSGCSVAIALGQGNVTVQLAGLASQNVAALTSRPGVIATRVALVGPLAAFPAGHHSGWNPISLHHGRRLATSPERDDSGWHRAGHGPAGGRRKSVLAALFATVAMAASMALLGSAAQTFRDSRKDMQYISHKLDAVAEQLARLEIDVDRAHSLARDLHDLSSRSPSGARLAPPAEAERLHEVSQPRQQREGPATGLDSRPWPAVARAPRAQTPARPSPTRAAGPPGRHGRAPERAAGVPERAAGPESHAERTSGELDMATVKRYIQYRRARIRECYNAALALDPGLHGTLVLEFEIDSRGAVSDVATAGMGPALGRCAASVIAAIQFPAVPNGDPVRVRYPFHLKPSWR